MNLIAVQGRGTPMCVHLPECTWADPLGTTPGNVPYPRIEVSLRRALDDHMVACKRCMLPLHSEAEYMARRS